MAEDKAENIKTVFRRFDANGDGTISSGELRTVLKAIGGGKEQFTDSEIDSAFARIDVNKDGMIQYNEFVDWLLDDTAGFTGICMEPTRNPDILSAVIADIEKADGRAGVEAASEELEVVCSTLEVEQKYAPTSETVTEAVTSNPAAVAPAEVDISSVDLDIDFTGDESDFLDCQALFRRLDAKKLRQVFAEADIDKSNFLQLSELQRFLFPGSSKDKSLCVSKIFAQMDKNHDGKVGCGEFCSYVISMKQMLSSIPTNADKKRIATAFSVTDSDRSADISADEFVKLLGASTEEEKATIQKAFGSLDRDRNGVLSVIEFGRVYGKELVLEARGPEVTWTEVPPDDDDD